jgi:hypothetical protein
MKVAPFFRASPSPPHKPIPASRARWSLTGRQVTDLIVIAGAAVQTAVASSRSMQGGVNISVAGGLPFGVSYLLDGAMHNDPQNNANLPMPFPDALQEFSVATSGLSAQNGMHSGASVNAVTKSGTNMVFCYLFPHEPQRLRDTEKIGLRPLCLCGSFFVKIRNTR